MTLMFKHRLPFQTIDDLTKPLSSINNKIASQLRYMDKEWNVRKYSHEAPTDAFEIRVRLMLLPAMLASFEEEKKRIQDICDKSLTEQADEESIYMMESFV